jgi:hypothetical protein
VDKVTVLVNDLLTTLMKADIEIRDIDIPEQMSWCKDPPSHSVFMKIGNFQTTFMGGCANKHFVVENYPYHKLPEH